MEHVNDCAEPVNDDVRLIRLIRDKPGLSMSEWAKDMGWFMPNGAPYHVKIARAIKRMEANGIFKRDASGNYVPIDDAESRVGDSAVGPFPIAHNDYLAVYEYLRRHPVTTFSAVARALGWTIRGGLPYGVKVERIIDRMVRSGNIKRELWTGSSSRATPRGRTYRYTLICQPIPENARPIEETMAPVSAAGIKVSRTIYTVADALGLIRHAASIASQLAKQDHRSV